MQTESSNKSENINGNKISIINDEKPSSFQEIFD